jgi:hypothetical protein
LKKVITNFIKTCTTKLVKFVREEVLNDTRVPK